MAAVVLLACSRTRPPYSTSEAMQSRHGPRVANGHQVDAKIQHLRYAAVNSNPHSISLTSKQQLCLQLLLGGGVFIDKHTIDTKNRMHARSDDSFLILLA